MGWVNESGNITYPGLPIWSKILQAKTQATYLAECLPKERQLNNTERRKEEGNLSRCTSKRAIFAALPDFYPACPETIFPRGSWAINLIVPKGESWLAWGLLAACQPAYREGGGVAIFLSKPLAWTVENGQLALGAGGGGWVDWGDLTGQGRESTKQTEMGYSKIKTSPWAIIGEKLANTSLK